MNAMPDYAPTNIRNVALVGHSGSGKTTLAEALLCHAGVRSRPGRVEEGTTACDFEPEARTRHLSIALSLAAFPVGTMKVNLLDTPGFADFFGEVRVACQAVDLVVIVVSAVEGVQAQTERAWDLAVEMGLPRVFFVNKLDRDQASFQSTLADLQERFGPGIAPVELPLGVHEGFHGIVDLLTDRAVRYEGGVPQTVAVPDDLAREEQQVREQLVEGIVVGDDTLMQRYLDGEVIGFEELETTLANGVAQASVFPVICGSAALGVGVDRLASLLVELAPSPLRGRQLIVDAAGTRHPVACDPTAPPLAQVIKTIADPYAGKISLLRVWSGTLHPDLVLMNTRARAEERLHVLELLRGAEATPVSEAQAGDMVAVPKLTASRTGDTLSPKGTPVTVADPVVFDPPVYTIAIHSRASGEDEKLMTGLHRLEEEDPTLVVERVDETHQTLLSGAGEMHLAVALEKLQNRYGIGIDIEPVLIAYRETIARRMTAEGRYKKQTGGHGQFGVAVLTVEPRPRGSGFLFQDAVVGGAIPKQYIPAVEKGVLEAMHHGGPHGYPVVDVSVTCTDGKYHPVDSSEMSFKMAGSLAFANALEQAGSLLLEPISHVEVTVPSALLGDVLSDLHARRGRVQSTGGKEGAIQHIEALVPTFELQRYATDLRSLTSGRGRFSRSFDHYDAVPEHLVNQVLASPAPEDRRSAHR
jgi:elongation factor G